ncbi:cell division protein FtsQ [Thermus composti]|nr:cell division protein FtsQ [Thermus composti]
MRGFLAGLLLITLYVGSLVAFPIERVEVEGLRHLKEEAVLKAVGLLPGSPWLWALPYRLEPLRKNPWVAEAHLERPRVGVVRLWVRERVPFLPLKDGDALAEDGTRLPGGAPWAPGPKVVGQGPLPAQALLQLARAFPKARRLRYTPVGFWVELPQATLFAPKAELLLEYAQTGMFRGQIYVYSWGVSVRP